MLRIGRPTDRMPSPLICAAPPPHLRGSLASRSLRHPPPPRHQLPDPLWRPPPRRSAGCGAAGEGTARRSSCIRRGRGQSSSLGRGRRGRDRAPTFGVGVGVGVGGAPPRGAAGRVGARRGACAGGPHRRRGHRPPLPAASPTQGGSPPQGAAELAGGVAGGRRSPQLPHAGRRRSSCGIHGGGSRFWCICCKHMLHGFKMFQKNIASASCGCCKSRSKCCIYFTNMLQVFNPNVTFSLRCLMFILNVP